MPRDDLSIDFVKKMPQGEVLDPSMVLDDWINRVQNLPEEIRFIQDEIADKDRQYNDCIKIIEERDARIQKFIKAHGSHETNQREEVLRTTIRENFVKAEQLADEKVALMEKMRAIMDKHLRQLDIQIKMLYDRNEPGFNDPDELPSLLRPGTTQPQAPARVPLTVNTNIAGPLSQINSTNTATPSTVRVANPIRSAQFQHTSASAPATPAASTILGRPREGSVGPVIGVPKRGPRTNSGLGALPLTSSGLARHSSLGPGTPKGHQTATGVQRAGSAGPRASTKGISSGGPGRKAGTPSSTAGRKKSAPVAAGAGVTKSGLSRVKRAAKNSPSSTADSELSEASSASGDEAGRSRTGTPGVGRASSASQNNNATTAGGNGNGGGGSGGNGASASNGNGNGGSKPQDGSGGEGNSNGPVSQARLKKERKDDDEEMGDIEIEDDEADADTKYCLCQNVSFGNMVACDNDECPFEWFHWSCVGIKSEPDGTWICPVCTEKMKKSGLKGK